ncbi:hypothetical protein PDIP_38550 [Penicillium digitatum Pd1]|uniref:Uncharacterized protein n=1 Tax=Penicillium digitatum (strain Pd1 / CECT 20795) TaxID=1170230 RepID=K9G4Q6_PEND1|nr:hypothetical protein PDIP_38550 [Penicillium digitatum Pd1]EKV15872.1 hypothetical protein PDIP_38550 [Penicillium digitatum Pd1]KAG0153649.1 hypothetical protein PDIDSM_2303 [Penicillium digitatum]
MIEAVNAPYLDAPYSGSEWDASVLHEAPSSTVKLSRVAESVFNIEGKVIDIKEFTDYQHPGMSLAATVLTKATQFWIKEGTANKDYSQIDLSKLRPGWSTWGRLLWSDWANVGATAQDME